MTLKRTIKTYLFGFIISGTVFAVIGCSPILIESNPDTYPIDSSRFSFSGTTSAVTIENAYKGSNKTTLATFGRDVECDLKQFTHTTVEILTRAFANQSVEVIENADKIISLRVYNVVFETGFAVFRITLILEAQLGNGVTVNVGGDARSGRSVERSVDAALTRAAVKLMQDPLFIEYINEQ